MTSIIFDKTDKGREEIATRKHQLSPRLRMLLVLIDGKQNTPELLEKFGGIGLNEHSLAELLDKGFIHPVPAPQPATVQAQAETAPIEPEVPARNDTAASLQHQFQAIYQFYTETIKSTIGLRGYALQLKVEKAASVADLRDLRQPYLDAVHKAHGPEMEQSLRARLDQLLDIGQNLPRNKTA